jgi:hypothetical protein
MDRQVTRRKRLLDFNQSDSERAVVRHKIQQLRQRTIKSQEEITCNENKFSAFIKEQNEIHESGMLSIYNLLVIFQVLFPSEAVYDALQLNTMAAIGVEHGRRVREQTMEFSCDDLIEKLQETFTRGGEIQFNQIGKFFSNVIPVVPKLLSL